MCPLPLSCASPMLPSSQPTAESTAFCSPMDSLQTDNGYVSQVHRVAITGGPCAGKTTALAEIAERLRSRGFGVYIVPEAATLMFTGGCSFAGMTSEQVLNFQTQLLRTQIALEDALTNVARMSGKESFVLCDRGVCDGRAYMTEESWREMLARNNWDIIELRDGRYDLVVHLVTAADGASGFYTLENNKARTETEEEAIALDRSTQNAWVGHPHLRVVDNKTGFAEKINRIDARISELAGLHLRKRVVRKYLLRDESREWDKVNGEVFLVEQSFLRRGGDGGPERESVRKRGKGGVYTYVHKVRQNGRDTKRQITSREYSTLLVHQDASRETVMIRRRCFLYGGKYFVLDEIENVEPGIKLLRCHCEVGERLEIPKWMGVEREVTGEAEYFMRTLSARATVAGKNDFERLTDEDSGHSEEANKSER